MALSTTQINELYVAYFGRPADFQGLVYYQNNNATPAQIAAAFSSSAESQALYNNSSTPALITAIYQNLFNRAPDTAGLTYWTTQILTGQISAAGAALNIADSGYAGGGVDAATLGNKVLVANAFVGDLNTVANINGYSGASAAASARAFLSTITNTTVITTVQPSVDAAVAAAVAVGGTVGTTFTLVTGVDVITGTANNDTIIGVQAATGSTLSAGDSIDGGAGIDTLKIVNTTTVAPADSLAGITVKNVEKLVVQNTGVANTYNLANTTGVTQVTSSNSGFGVTFSNLATGTQVVASGTGATTTNFNMATLTDAVSVGFDGGANSQSIGAGAGSVATAATLSSTGAANGTSTGADIVFLTGGAGQATVKTLAVNATTNLKVQLTAADFVATGAAVTVGGLATSVDLGSNGVFKTIDASGLTAGGLTITTSGAGLVTSIIGGAGSDTITLGAALNSAATINLGAGNDTLIGTAAIPSTAVIDGGAGTDYISAALVNVGSAANIKNFEGLDITGFNVALDASLLTNSVISNLQFSGSAALATTAIIQNLAAATTINVIGAIDQATVVAGNLGNVTLTQTGTPTLALSFNATPAAIGTTAAPGGFFSSVGTVNETGNTVVTIASLGNSFVVGNGLANLSETSNKLATVTLTGDHAFTLGQVHTDVGATITATTASSLTLIDGSAMTGKLTVVAGANDTVNGQQLTYTGLTINGGAAADVITNSAKNGVVNGGAGNDTINISIPVAGATSDTPTVNGGAGADTLVSTLAYGQAASAITSSTSGNFVIFNDATTGDIVKFGTVANATGSLGSAANVSAASTFDQAVFLAESGTANTVTWFVYAGNTYIENSGATVGAGNSTDNIVIKVNGTPSLTAAAVVTGAGGTVTFA